MQFSTQRVQQFAERLHVRTPTTRLAGDTRRVSRGRRLRRLGTGLIRRLVPHGSGSQRRLQLGLGLSLGQRDRDTVQMHVFSAGVLQGIAAHNLAGFTLCNEIGLIEGQGVVVDSHLTLDVDIREDQRGTVIQVQVEPTLHEERDEQLVAQEVGQNLLVLPAPIHEVPREHSSCSSIRSSTTTDIHVRDAQTRHRAVMEVLKELRELHGIWLDGLNAHTL